MRKEMLTRQRKSKLQYEMDLEFKREGMMQTSSKVFLKREGMMPTSKPKGHTQQDWNIKIK